MGKTLRVGFAMGGGVSLGTFSGAALSEAIKLLLLEGRYTEDEGKTWKCYENIVIDVFSGASAGAMSLLIMLRGLVYQDARQINEATKNLEEWSTRTGINLPDAQTQRWNQLIAAQVVQDMQQAIWTKDINIKSLLADPENDLSIQSGLLNRRTLERIAARYIRFPPENVKFNAAGLLDERTLFACTLSSLVPMIADARGQYANAGFLGLGDGLRSRVHRDLRVFDLYLKENWQSTEEIDEMEFPRRWCRYQTGEKIEGQVGDLRLSTGWAKMAATAIACGCFPFAFEPVVLTRHDYEFGDLWKEMFKDFGHGAKTLQEPYDKDSAVKLKEYPFTYVDGGTFNNEPIREAFRMASFIDAGLEPETFDRLIVFVDPFVNPELPQFRIPVHQEYNLHGKDHASLRYTLGKLLAHVPTLLGAISDQSRVTEANKIYKAHDKFKERAGIRSHLLNTLIQNPTLDDVQNLFKYCVKQLEHIRVNEVVPAGRLCIQEEMKRVLSEEKGNFKALAAPNNAQGKVDNIVSLLKGKKRLPDEELNWVHRVLSLISVDLVMDMEGKRKAKLVAIAPFVFDTSAAKDGTMKRIDLPGGWLGAFAGFISETANTYNLGVAAYCARSCLSACKVIKPPSSPQIVPSPLNPQAYKKMIGEMQEQVELVLVRLERMIGDCCTIARVGLNIADYFGFFKQFKKDLIALEKYIPPRIEFEIRIQVPDDDCTLVNHHDKDDSRSPKIIKREHVIIASAAILEKSLEENKLTWIGDFVKDNSIVLSDASGNKSPIILPNLKMVRNAFYYPCMYFEMNANGGNYFATNNAWTIELENTNPLEISIEKKF